MKNFAWKNFDKMQLSLKCGCKSNQLEKKRLSSTNLYLKIT